MPRGERPLDAGDGVLLRFASDLRALRRAAGGPTYRVLAQRAHYSAATLSDAAAGRRLPSLAVALAYVRACGGDVDEWSRRWHAVAAALAAEQGTTGAADGAAGAAGPGDPRPPYVGLAAFQPRDADRFFGREQLVADLGRRLATHRFVAVFGASGAGKSSLLRAGLVPSWQTGAPPPAVVLCTPTDQPFEECALALAGLTGAPPARVRAQLAAHPRGLHRTVRQALAGRPHDAELLLVVDQFEEVFTLCRDPAERTAFIDALITAARTGGSRCRVVLGVRADFYAHCTGHRELVELLDGGQVTIGPMTLDELRRAVVQPAARAGYTLEGALVATLVAQTHGRVGVLPMLSHALLETWHRRRGNTLTLAGFQAAGGIEGALAHTAESLYRGLPPHEQALVRELFLRLTALGEGTEDTKRRIRRDEVASLGLGGDGGGRGRRGGSPPNGGAANGGAPDGGAPNGGAPDGGGILERLVRARLLTLDGDRVELTHEVLIRCWPRLHGWLAEDREGLRVHRQLTEAAHAWHALGRDPGALYRGARLAVADSWADRRRPTLTPLEEEFLTASRRARDVEQAAARRRTRRARQLVALLSVLLVVAAAATVQAVRTSRVAARERDVAAAQMAARQAAAMRLTDPALAAQLSLAAYRLAPTAETRGALLSSFAAPYAGVLTGTGRMAAVAFSPNGRRLATAGHDRVARLWDTTDIHRPQPVGTMAGHADAVRAVAFSPDGRTLVTGGADGAVRRWDVTDPARPAATVVHPGGTGPVHAVAVSRDGRTLAAAGADRRVRLWDLADPGRARPLATLAGHTDAVHAVVFAAGGGLLATGAADGTVRLWDTADRSRPVRTRPRARTGAVRAVALGPDGRTLATGGADSAVRLWSVADPARPVALATVDGHTDAVDALAFSPDGQRLASAGVDATVRVWHVADPRRARPLRLLRGHTADVTAVAFSPDGRTLASASADYTSRLWELPGPVLAGHTSSIYAVAFHPAGRTLATGGYDRTVRLWDATDPQRPRQVAVLAGHAHAVNSVAFSPDGALLATAGADRTLRLWDVTRPSRATPLGAPVRYADSVEAVAFSPRGGVLAVGAADRTVQLWDVTDPRRRRPLVTLTGHTGAVTAAAFSPDGRVLATAGADHTARLWDVTDPRRPGPLGVLAGHTDAIESVAFSPDGDTLATAAEDRSARLWQVADRRRPAAAAVLTGYTDGVKSAAFSPDGDTLATASSDGTLRLWGVGDPRRAVALATLVGHAKPVDAVAYSPDGRTIATGSEDHSGLLWSPDPERVADRICIVAHPRVTGADLAAYLPPPGRQPPCETEPARR